MDGVWAAKALLARILPPLAVCDFQKQKEIAGPELMRAENAAAESQKLRMSPVKCKTIDAD